MPRSSVVRVDAVTLVERSAAALRGLGAPDASARLQAEHLVEAELRGHPSHGLRRLFVLAARVDAGLIDPAAQPSFEWTAPSALVVDGNRGFGPVTAYLTIDMLLHRVRQTGIVAAAMRRTHHLGMLSPYLERMAGSGCIGLVLSSTEGLVHPWGGAGALLGTNPLGIGVPAAGSPLTLDMSTGAVSAGKILDYAARGMTLPEGWAVDAEGRSTTDAARAVSGAISPFGGAKGYALGLSLGAVVGVLTGTALGADVRGTLDAEFETTKGDVIVAIDVAVFGGSAGSPLLADYFAQLRGSGIDGRAVTVPGDRARASRELALADGVDVSADVWDRVSELLASQAVDTPGTDMRREGITP
ncbi:Ldh family oxidoreductase [Luethyella okanaganae]|uniref:Ldh family oxidoreductase n=1 Tax=Luethyella okanaganae TaxID=69372 RepID=A0ABW1VG50_9MICO